MASLSSRGRCFCIARNRFPVRRQLDSSFSNVFIGGLDRPLDASRRAFSGNFKSSTILVMMIAITPWLNTSSRLEDTGSYPIAHRASCYPKDITRHKLATRKQTSLDISSPADRRLLLTACSRWPLIMLSCSAVSG